MGIEKSIKKLLSEPTEMRISEIINIMAFAGFKLIRIRGSHYQFKKDNKLLVTIPVHNSKIQKYYLKVIKRIIIDSAINPYIHG